ncbi:MAG: hypothetical protein ACI3XQ_10835, partial [Eubacteriales bacterium]
YTVDGTVLNYNDDTYSNDKATAATLTEGSANVTHGFNTDISNLVANGQLVSAEVFASAEMATKLGEAFTFDAGNSQYPIGLVANTDEEPSAGDEEEPVIPVLPVLPGDDDEDGEDGEKTETEAPTGTDETKAPEQSDSGTEKKDDEKKSGCGSTVGVSVILVVGTAAIGATVLTKKKKH